MLKGSNKLYGVHEMTGDLFSTYFLGVDVSARVPFCPTPFNVTHSLHLYYYL